MNIMFRRYSPLLIFWLWYYSLLSSHPIDCNILTQYSHHKTFSSELALALVIGLNTKNSATDKGSARKILYQNKSVVSDGYTRIVTAFLSYSSWAPLLSIAIFGGRERSSISPFAIWMRNNELHQHRPTCDQPIAKVWPSPSRCGADATLWRLPCASCTDVPWECPRNT